MQIRWNLATPIPAARKSLVWLHSIRYHERQPWQRERTVMNIPTVLSFFDKDTKSYSYVVADEQAGACAIIDSVLDFDIKSGRTSTDGADALIAAVKERGWRTEWVLETHAHADHLTAAAYVKAQLGGRLGIGANIPTVQETFRAIYNLGS